FDLNWIFMDPDPYPPDPTYVASSSVRSSPLGGEVVLLEPEEGRYYCLDPVGTRIWELIQTPVTWTTCAGGWSRSSTWTSPRAAARWSDSSGSWSRMAWPNPVRPVRRLGGLPAHERRLLLRALFLAGGRC